MSTPQTAAPASLAAPPSGSSRYFALLYTPPLQRRRVHSLMNIADELAVSLGPQLAHEVAHVRLAWWQEESERLVQGRSSHPLARELQTGTPDAAPAAAELARLVQATAVALARRQLTASAIPPLERALFPAIGALLLPLAPSAPERILLAAMGDSVHSLECPDEPSMDPDAQASPAATVAARLWGQLQQLEPTRLPALAPLIVWSALALQHAAQPRRPRPNVSLRAGFADNILAWRSARAALREALPPFIHHEA